MSVRLQSLIAALGILALGACASTAAVPAPEANRPMVKSTISLMPDSAIAALLRERVASRKTPGLVVGILDASGQRFISAGTGAPGPAELDGNTLFEIGSITKVFTSAILADMVLRGEVALADPLAKYLPAGTRAPSRDGRQITLLDLATHMSGLPRLPNNLSPRDAANPYVDYTSEKLYAFLSGHELRRAVGAQFEYSNLGAGLLGHLLELRTGLSYETLVTARILRPLAMTHTRITLSEDDRRLLAAGHTAGGRVTPPWDLGVLAGAGALRSTARDVLRFLEANIQAGANSAHVPLPALRMTHDPRHAIGPGAHVGMGWISRLTPSGTIFMHDGGTGGHRSFAAFDPARGVAVVVLSASSTDVADLGLALLDSGRRPSSDRVAITLPETVLEGLVGEYEIVPAFRITVTREGAQLYVQATSQPRFPVFAESENAFFLRVVDAQVTFERGADGRATTLTLHQGGVSQPGRRVK